MKVLEKKMDKVISELTSEENGRLGFDKIWDDIRLIYPASKFEVDHVDENHNGKIIIINLIDLDFYNSILRLNKNIKDDEI